MAGVLSEAPTTIKMSHAIIGEPPRTNLAKQIHIVPALTVLVHLMSLALIATTVLVVT